MTNLDNREINRMVSYFTNKRESVVDERAGCGVKMSEEVKLALLTNIMA